MYENISNCRKLMIQGTMSGVGKSILTAIICRILSSEGYRVRPFKSQNMSSVFYGMDNGDIMASAQALQAIACGAQPHPDMNPLLIVPMGDRRSRIYLRGKLYGEYSVADFYGVRPSLTDEILTASDNVCADADVLVIEGAGGCAEINLRQDDIVNMGLAQMLGADVILVGDIEPGGVFAQLYGSYMLLSESDRKLIKGFIINKFRGDEEILRPGIEELEHLTGVPVLGVLPWMDVELPDEDSFMGAGGKSGKGRLQSEPLSSIPSDVILAELDRLAEMVSSRIDMPGVLLQNID